MTFDNFIAILVVSATATSLGIEVIKTLLTNFKINFKTICVATVAAFIVGGAEIFVFYVTKGIKISISTFLYAICMGIANTVATNVGYDKVKQLLLTVMAKTK